jgi:hypothetical protein
MNDENNSNPKPIFKIKEKNIKAHYYYDGSGEICISSGSKYREDVFYEDNDRLCHHILSLEEQIKQNAADTLIMKRAVKLLKKEKKKHKL